jgi:hypothetical protein
MVIPLGVPGIWHTVTLNHSWAWLERDPVHFYWSVFVFQKIYTRKSFLI